MTPRDLVNHIQKVFTLNIEQLADALRVKVSTIWGWKGCNREIAMCTEDLKRLSALASVADRCDLLGPLRGGGTRSTINGRSLFDELCAPTLDPNRIEHQYRYVLSQEEALRHAAGINAQKIAEALAQAFKD